MVRRLTGSVILNIRYASDSMENITASLDRQNLFIDTQLERLHSKIQPQSALSTDILSINKILALKIKGILSVHYKLYILKYN